MNNININNLPLKPPLPLPKIPIKAPIQQLPNTKFIKPRSLLPNNRNTLISPPTTIQQQKHIQQTKTDEDKCEKHIVSMLEKLSQYNNTTKREMSKKLDDKFRRLHESVEKKYSKLPNDQQAAAIQV